MQLLSHQSTFRDFQLGKPETLAAPTSPLHIFSIWTNADASATNGGQTLSSTHACGKGRERRFLWPGFLESVNLDQRFLLTVAASARPGLRANTAPLSEPRLPGMKAFY